MSESSLEVDRPSPAAIGRASFQLWLLLVALGAFVGSLWLLDWPDEPSLGLRVYVLLGLLSSVAMLALVPGALFLVAQRVISAARWIAWIEGLLGACFLALLYTDTVIYRLLRYHVNAAVLNVLKTSGSEDAVHLGPRVWILAVVVIGSLTVLFRSFARALAQARREREGHASSTFLRPRVLCALIFLPIVFVEKSVWAAAQITEDEEVISACRDLPLHPRIRLARLLGREQDEIFHTDVLPADAELAYPRAWPTVDPAGPRPNILLLVIDSWRRDVFTREITPRLWSFSTQARVFEDHLSGGNGTRFAVFAMLYGLHGSYWFPVLEAQAVLPCSSTCCARSATRRASSPRHR
jgi:membrane-anchored protein YejM (alkaline phosphatase superfamily)